jgi:hypothetical protein
VALRSSTLPGQLSQETGGHPTRRRDPAAAAESDPGSIGCLSSAPMDAIAFCWAFPSACSGNRWGVLTFVAGDGVMQVGRYVDFHNSDGRPALRRPSA